MKVGKNRKIIVAMSGGVDSSVAAALLKERGYDVRGVFMRLWKSPNYAEKYPSALLRAGAEPRGKKDNAEENTKAVAKKLGIPLKILDFKKEFKKSVVDYFLKEFACVRTPNPCVVCNQKIKFGLLLDKALEMGGDYISTGHYARVEPPLSSLPWKGGKRGEVDFKKNRIIKIYHLLMAKDKTKDQSYFLYNLTQEKLKRILFPIGDYTKKEVYQMAEKRGLPFQKKESVDICFLARQDHREFLNKYLKLKPGKIVSTNGNILGEHKGLSLYTIGQRADIGGPGPFYVVRMNLKKNELIVSNNPRDLMLFGKSLVAENVNWVAGGEPELALRCRAKIRYGHAAVPVVVDKRDLVPQKGLSPLKQYFITFQTPQRAITPGQSIVFYQRNEVLGGGVIS